jgi:hypothetical protein
MNREKYVFNPSTLQYEKVERTLREKLIKVSGFLVVVFLTSIFLFSVAYTYFPTPKERALAREMAQMEFYYNDLSEQYTSLTTDIDALQKKDAEVHRAVFGLDPLDNAVWEGGTGGRESLVRLANNNDANQVLNQILDKADKLKRKVQIQTSSLNELIDVASTNEDKLASIPSIKPVQEDKLKRKVRHLSGFGRRIHPVHKVRKMHHGIDFTAPAGTPIQATGNGVVERVEKRKTGYGRNIIINHGYGYKTLYAHLSSVEVNKGDRVMKGQRIGTVGSTGTSTAPHCHYEVRVNNVPVNPINYVMDGLSPEEYEDLVARAQEENQSLD